MLGDMSRREHFIFSLWRTTFERFQSAGTLPVLIDKLNSDVREGAISSANDLSTHAVMPSGPADEWGFIV